MADQDLSKPWTSRFFAEPATAFWRALIGLLPFLQTQGKAFVEWAAAGERLKMSPALWHEIRDVAQSLPLMIAKLCICAGMVLNLCRAQVEVTPTADPLDGAALVSADLPQIQGWFWLAALWLILSVLEKVVKSITINIVSKA